MQIKRIFISLFFIGLFSCSSDSVSPAPDELYSGNWVLWNSSPIGITSPLSTTLDFQPNGKVSGLGVCNEFRGTFITVDNRIFIFITERTEPSCGDQHSIEREAAYFRIFEDAYSYIVETDSLTLFNSEKEMIAVFKTGLIN